MSEHGASLQTYNQELVKLLEDMKIKRNEILALITEAEQEKKTLESHMRALQDKLDVVKSSLKQHRELYQSYQKTIEDTESGFKKILESSHTLLNLAQHEATKLENYQKKEHGRSKLDHQYD